MRIRPAKAECGAAKAAIDCSDTCVPARFIFPKRHLLLLSLVDFMILPRVTVSKTTSRRGWGRVRGNERGGQKRCRWAAACARSGGEGGGFPKRKAVKEGKRLTNFPVGCTIITLCELECVAQYHTWKGLQKRPKKYRPKISCRFPCFKTSNSLEFLSGRNIVLLSLRAPRGSAQGPDGGGGRGPGCPPARVENRPGGKKRDPREKQEDPGHRAARARVNIIRLCLGRRSSRRLLLVVVVVVEKASSATQNEEAARSVGV